LNVKKCTCWCLSIIELKNAWWNIEICDSMFILAAPKLWCTAGSQNSFTSKVQAIELHNAKSSVRERQLVTRQNYGLPESSNCPWSRTVLMSDKCAPENATCHLSAAESGSGVPGGRRNAKRHHPDGTVSLFWCMPAPFLSFWQHSQ